MNRIISNVSSEQRLWNAKMVKEKRGLKKGTGERNLNILIKEQS